MINSKRDVMRFLSLFLVMTVVVTSAINVGIFLANGNTLGDEYILPEDSIIGGTSPLKGNSNENLPSPTIEDDNVKSWNKVLKMAGLATSEYDSNLAKVFVDEGTVEIVIRFKNSDGYNYDTFTSNLEKGCEVVQYIQQLNAISVRVPIDKLANIMFTYENLEQVRYVQPNQYITTNGVPDDPQWSQQWGPQRIDVPKAWALETGDFSEVLVAIIDSGIDYNHPDLSAQYVALGYDWYNDDSDPYDDFGHGTHCAGIIAATINNTLGIAGVANVKIMAEKFLDSYGSGDAMGGANSIIHAVDVGADILSNSWGGGAPDELIEDALKYAAANDVVIVASAGNGYGEAPNYPAYYPEAISVSATDVNDDLAVFSTYGSTIEIAAPGVDIYSTLPVDQGSYGNKSGTSMACPHVSGVAALIKSAFPSWSAERIRARLQEATEDLGAPGRDIYFGYGLINAWYAVQPPQPHDLKVTIEAPNMQSGNTTIQLNATIYNYGLNNETSVELEMYINNSLVESQVFAELKVNENGYLSYNWTPSKFGEYNITAYAVPVTGETWLVNNNVTVISNVVPPEKRILFIQNHGESSYINQLGDFYTDLGYFVDYLTSGNITSSLLSNYKYAFTSEGGYDWIPTEVIALNNFMLSGGLFAGIGDSGPTYGTIELAEMYGITFTGSSSGTGGATSNINTFHPIMSGVSTLYLPSPYNAIAVTAPAEWIIKDASNAYTYGACVDVGLGYFVVLADDFGSSVDQEDNAIMFENLLHWPSYDHDITAFLDYEKPHKDEESNITVSALNRGLENETSIEIELYINGTKVANKTIAFFVTKTFEYLHYNWTPLEFAVYNITAFVTITASDEEPNNNILTKFLRILDLKNYYMIEDAFYNWIGTSGGTLIPLSDDSSATIQLPFDFTFYDQIFSEIHVSSNGWLSFVNPGCSNLNGPAFPSTETAFQFAIAPYLTDLYPSDNIYYLILTNPNRFVVIYDSINYFGGGFAGSFEVILYETGEIQMQYKGLTNTYIPSTVGLNYGLDTEFYNYVSPYAEPFIGTTDSYSIFFTQYRHDHELIASLEANTHMQLSDSQIINATTYNFGLLAETDVEVRIWVNSTIEETEVYSLINANTFETLQYSLTAHLYGVLNVTFEILPVFNETNLYNNKITIIISVFDTSGKTVAILDSYTTPSYIVGGVSNNYGIIEVGLNSAGYTTLVVTNDDIKNGILNTVSILLLIDNLPDDAASIIIGDWCKAGGNILSFDSSICLLNYEGILPPESAGSPGYNEYWDYESNTLGYIRNADHPIMAGYSLDDYLTGTSGNAQFFNDEIALTTAGQHFTSLVEDQSDSTKSYVSVYDNPSFGKVVQIWINDHWSNLAFRQMITNTIDWFDSTSDMLSLTVENPKQGKTIVASVKIKWTTSHANELPVTCNVDYWNGSIWINLVTETTESSYRWNTMGLEKGDFYQIRLNVSDGTNSLSVIVNDLTINNNLIFAYTIPAAVVVIGASIGLGFYLSRRLKRRTNLG
ncbi:MAG: S8 family serine peptidase [Candidatus Heimdallarchaeota archaeon]